MSRLLATCAVGAFLALAAPARAQVCRGQAAFGRYALQLSGSAEFGDTAKAFGAGLGLGGHRLFVESGLARTSYDNGGGARGTLSLYAGYALSLDKQQLFQFCPVVAVEFGRGPHNVNIGAGVPGNRDEVDWIFGFSAGAQTAPWSGVRVIPTVAFSVVQARATLKDNIVGHQTSQSESFELLDLGLGLLLKRVTVLPGVSIPLGVDGASGTFHLTVSVKVPKKPPIIR
jgi:hypothetical protein